MHVCGVILNKLYEYKTMRVFVDSSASSLTEIAASADQFKRHQKSMAEQRTD